MARQHSDRQQESQAIEPRRRNQSLQEKWSSLSPFSLMRRFAEDMDRVFEGFGIPTNPGRLTPWTAANQYLPDVDMFERDGKLVVRADLPGVNKDDIKVEITENAISIQGERKYEHEANEGGVYRSERSYGHFRRDIPLPEGVNTENAAARFKDGVLEVSVDAPQPSKNRRQIQIQEDSGPRSGKSAA